MTSSDDPAFTNAISNAPPGFDSSLSAIKSQFGITEVAEGEQLKQKFRALSGAKKGMPLLAAWMEFQNLWGEMVSAKNYPVAEQDLLIYCQKFISQSIQLTNTMSMSARCKVICSTGQIFEPLEPTDPWTFQRMALLMLPALHACINLTGSCNASRWFNAEHTDERTNGSNGEKRVPLTANPNGNSQQGGSGIQQQPNTFRTNSGQPDLKRRKVDHA